MEELFTAIENHKLVSAILLIWSGYICTISIKIHVNEKEEKKDL